MRKTVLTLPLDRREVVRTLLRDRGGMLVVAGLGSTVWDCAAAGDHSLTFPVWGAMGGASMVGLGLALAQPSRPVMVITGDGELLMQLGGLATIAAQRPPNLCIAVLDNEVYLETGGQPTHTAFGTDLAGVARACGITEAKVLTRGNEVEALAQRTKRCEGTTFAQIKIGATRSPLVMPPRDGSHLKDRFRQALLGNRAFE